MSKKDLKRLSRDAAGVGPYARERSRLVPLSEMKGWNVENGEADVRTWEVRTLAGRILGHVRELFIDPKAGEVIMLDVDVAGTDRQAYLPLRLVEIDRNRRLVRADSGDLETHEAAGSTRLSREELSRVRQPDDRGAGSSTEKVVERRPIVEETVVRRRLPGDPETRL
jgi:hypothetical protein